MSQVKEVSSPPLTSSLIKYFYGLWYTNEDGELFDNGPVDVTLDVTLFKTVLFTVHRHTLKRCRS